MTSRALVRRVVIGTLVIVAAVVVLVIYNHLYRQQSTPPFDSDEKHFLYGSIGTEAEGGVPYWIWLVLPRIFPEYLPAPGGYASLGMLSKDGAEMPVGLSKVTIGYPRVGINCAMCHAASVRAAADGVPTVYPAAASHQTDAQAYLRFLVACAADPRFTPGTILGEIAKNVRLSLVDRVLYRLVVIPNTRRSLLRLGDMNAWTRDRPDGGRGRVDLFNWLKFATLRQPVDGSVGNSDMMPLWNLRSREGKAFNWDGSNTTLREVVQSSAIGSGTTTTWLDRDAGRWDSTDPQSSSSLRRVVNYIQNLQAPKYPFAIDAQLAAAGAPIYRSQCAQCHESGTGRTGSVIPLAEIGTDRHRLETWTADAAAAYKAYSDRHPWKFSSFRKTDGYVAAPLAGVWLSAPYLHNGSVPTLADLLEAPSIRPVNFWRGYDVYDPIRAGFVTNGPEAERAGTRYDVALPGNSNAGHAYGTSLTPDEKRRLIEYLKTL